MASFDELLQTLPQKVLKRSLTEEERQELLELSSALGMKNVEDYLYMILTMKFSEDKLGVKLEQMTRVSENIDKTLSETTERVLTQTASKVVGDMAKGIAAEAINFSNLIKEYQRLRAHIMVILALGFSMLFGYFLGSINSGSIPFWLSSGNNYIGAIFSFPMGWVLILSSITYSFFWALDNSKEVKKNLKVQCVFIAQIVIIALLVLLAV